MGAWTRACRWIGLALWLGAIGCAAPSRGSTADWRGLLAERAEAFGHRNWIAVVDAAYPEHAQPGVESVVVDADALEVLEEVLATLERTGQLRATAYTDLELASLDEYDAPGIDGFRAALTGLLGARPVERLPHGEIVRQLASTAENFRVLVLKSRTRLPYTSVFLQLDCAYWSDDAEVRLRAKANRTPR